MNITLLGENNDADRDLAEYINTEQLTSSPSIEPSLLSPRIFECFSPHEYDMDHTFSAATSPIKHAEKSPFLWHSPERLVGDSSESAYSSRESSQTLDTDETLYVRRSMIETRKKRKIRPTRCSLSMRAAGSSVRQIYEVEEVPIICQRIVIRHCTAGFEKTLEIPEIMTTARRKRLLSVDMKKDELEDCGIKMESIDPMLRPVETDVKAIKPVKRRRGRPRKSEVSDPYDTSRRLVPAIERLSLTSLMDAGSTYSFTLL